MIEPQKLTVHLKEISPILKGLIKDNTDVTITITGNSMFPMLHHKKDQVILTKCNNNLKKGDIPLYQRTDGKYILHRIIKVNSDGSYLITGDNQTSIEKGITSENIIAVVKSFTKKGKYISCNSIYYKLYWKTWIAILPARPYILMSIRLLSKIKRKIF